MPKAKRLENIILILNIFEIMLKLYSIFHFKHGIKASFTFVYYLYFQVLEERSSSRLRIVTGTATVLYVTNAKRRWSAKVSL